MSTRGRGRKATTKIIIQNEGDINGMTDSIPVQETKTASKRTSRKKQFPVIAVITPDGIEGNLLPETRRPLIAHLPIQSKDVIFHDSLLHYDPTPPKQPEPYNTDMNTTLSFADDDKEKSALSAFDPNANYQMSFDNEGKNTSELFNNHDNNSASNNRENIYANKYQNHASDSKNTCTTCSCNKNNTTTYDKSFEYYKNAQTLLIQYKNSSEVQKIPETSTVACFWCCHIFEGKPCVLPIRDEGTHIQVEGNYCSPECAMAHLFDTPQDSHMRWERLAILNRIYKDKIGSGRIYPAMNRCVLQMFGGPYTIEEYRALMQSSKVRVDVHLPPMVSILATMDTKPIDFYDTSISKTVLETTQERIVKAEEVLRLKRTKPLKAWESTLDACMNLRIHQEENTTLNNAISAI